MATFKLASITREHILQAIGEIERHRPSLRASTVYDVVYKGKRYPPRELLRLAHKAATGTAVDWAVSASTATNAYLEKLGFAVVTKQPLFLPPTEDENIITEVSAPAEIAVAISNPGVSLVMAAEEKPTYVSKKYQPYSVSLALTELFLAENQLLSLLAALRRKKNLILQGPPGTGKSYLAKRLAFLDQEGVHSDRIEVVQFHSGYSYDDFIQGYRPDANGRFKLTNGVFYEFCLRAAANPHQSYYFLIEEINRGNVSSIFGEMLFLLEADKRGPLYATSLTYGASENERFYIPENVFVIGTMNTADRKLALLDYALRRRFAFFKMEPQFNAQFQNYLASKNVNLKLIKHITSALKNVNQVITADPALGAGFQIGHSYFSTPPLNADLVWFNSIVQNEIAPLLEEYWPDNDKQVAALLHALEAE